MGMFDYIKHEIKCPNCHSKMIIREQIKWTNKCRCHTYKVGDEIDAEDGEYTYATNGRPVLLTTCKNCGEEFIYKAIVEKGVLKEIDILASMKEINSFDSIPKLQKIISEINQYIANRDKVETICETDENAFKEKINELIKTKGYKISSTNCFYDSSLGSKCWTAILVRS